MKRKLYIFMVLILLTGFTGSVRVNAERENEQNKPCKIDNYFLLHGEVVIGERYGLLVRVFCNNGVVFIQYWDGYTWSGLKPETRPERECACELDPLQKRCILEAAGPSCGKYPCSGRCL